LGILPEYYKHLSEVTGSEFECIPYISKDAATEALNEGKVDMVGKFGNDVFDANSHGVILTMPYLNMNLVQITRAGTSSVMSISVPQCNEGYVEKAISLSGSKTEIKTCANSEESFDELKKGAVDSVICTQPAATWLLNRNRASDYVVSAFGAEAWSISGALSQNDDGNTMRSIIDKTITVDGGYINQLITKDTLEDSADLSGIFDRLPVSVIAAFASVEALLFAIVAVALIIIIRRRRTERELEIRKANLFAAEQANKAKHTFFGAVSHDMRTPLNGIMGFTELALESGDVSVMKDYLSKIRLSGSILSNLVNDTLIMSRIENGKYIINPSPNDMKDVVSEVIEPVRELAAQKNIVFTDNISDMGTSMVIMDRLSIQKIFLNLLSNAIKFTQPGGSVKLEGTFSEASDGKLEFVFTVADTGKGISKEFIPHIFEPFAQENPVNSDTSGSGMGLSIVKKIIDTMGGTIEVESEKDKGTKFIVSMQLAKADTVNTPERNNYSGENIFEGTHALVCEDNALNLEILRSILVHAGAEVDTAKNGADGLEAFKKSKDGFYDFILLDLRMPLMDGITAARAIRALDRNDAKKVPVFAVSADAYPENIKECLDAGMNGHISKPIDINRLKNTIAAFISKK